MSTKLSGLTALNVAALRETNPREIGDGDLVLTATTATWPNWSPTKALEKLALTMSVLPAKGHPRASLHAVERKLVKERQHLMVINAESAQLLNVETQEFVEDDAPAFIDEVEWTNTDALLAGALPEVPPIDPAAMFLLTLLPDNLFEPYNGTGSGKFRCKGCSEIVTRSNTAAHFNAHKAQTQEVKMTDSAKPAKAPKPNAKSLGVPAVYLSANGSFYPGGDAALKSDLILAILEQPARANAKMTWTKPNAEKLFAQFPQWAMFLTRKQEILKAKAIAAEKKADEKKAAAEKKAADKKAKPAVIKQTTEEVVDAEQAKFDAGGKKPGAAKPDPKPTPKPKATGRGRSSRSSK